MTVWTIVNPDGSTTVDGQTTLQALAASSGAGLVGVTGGGSVQAVLDTIPAQFAAQAAATAGKVSSVTATSPINASGGTTAMITIDPATSINPGSMSAANFAKLATIATNATVFPAPKTGTGVGQWTQLIVVAGVGGSITLPASGTWAYLFSNNGGANAGASVAPGGTVVFSGNVTNVLTLGWRIA